MTGGYDAVFLHDLPDIYRCPICYLAQQDPVQTTCGHRFCRTCLNECNKAHNNNGGNNNDRFPCPTDRSMISMAEVFSDVAREREILSLIVTCSDDDVNLNEEACGWQGELRQLDKHRNNCPHVKIKCPNEGCNARLPRCNVQQHVSSTCDYRKLNCVYCDESILLREEQVHQQQCSQRPTPCVNDCGADVRHDFMNEHLKECPESILKCPYDRCQFRGNLSERESHNLIDVEKHLFCASEKITDSSLKQLLTTACERICNLQMENRILKERLDEVGNSSQARMNERQTPGTYSCINGRSNARDSEENQCPVCNVVIHDMEKLQTHIMVCLDDASLGNQ